MRRVGQTQRGLAVFVASRQCGAMKTRFLPLLCGLLLAGGAGHLQAAPGVPAQQGAAATDEEMGEILGIEIARANGRYLGLEIVSGNFKLTFYNEKKKPEPVDVARATARWQARTKPFREFNVLNPSGDGHSLAGNRFVRPPHIFIVYLTLMHESGEVAESHQVQFGGAQAADQAQQEE